MSGDLLQVVRDSLDSLKAQDVVAFDVKKRTTVTDYMIVATGSSKRHVRSVADKLIEDAKAHGCRPLGVEGMEAGDWVLVDLNDIVVHVMRSQTREFYMLENLWGMPE